jgi:acid phosphatase
MRRSTLHVALFAAVLGLGACRTMTPADAAAPPAAEVPPAAAAATVPANDNLNAVLWMQRAAEYRATCETVYHAAADRLDAALKDPLWDAIAPGERANPARGLPPAVVLDVDETVLDNSPYQARLVRSDDTYDEATWDAWVREEKAQALPGVLDFAKAATARGITLIYISNRADHLGPATLSNLRKAGLPVKDDSVFLGLGTFVEGCEQEGSEKLCRRQLAARNYRVLMQFGDQLGDFTQVIANSPDARDALEAQYRGWFGQRWWALPNPTYGSWEPAMFNNAWSEPVERRRALKRDALNTAE